jgi:hypothetical protein
MRSNPGGFRKVAKKFFVHGTFKLLPASMRPQPASIRLPQPEVTEGDLAGGALNLRAKQAGGVIGEEQIIIHEDGHQPAVEYVQKDAPAGDDGVLGPLTVSDEST